MISIIAALDENSLIGSAGSLPWHMPADLRRFKKVTAGKPIIMGRKTYASIGRPLPHRINIVISKSLGKIPGCVAVRSAAEALEKAGHAPEIMVIGGYAVYAHFLPLAARLYLTRIHHMFQGDVYFPAYDAGEWQEVLRENYQPDEKNNYPYTFFIFERKSAV